MSKFTPEQIARMNTTVADSVKKHHRGWTRDEFKEAFKKQGFTFTDFERGLSLRPSSVSQSLSKRFPKVDKLISAFLDVPVHVLWPNQYLRNGLPINHRYYDPEIMTDEELERLNAATENARERIVVPFPSSPDPRPVTLPPGISLPKNVT